MGLKPTFSDFQLLFVDHYFKIAKIDTGIVMTVHISKSENIIFQYVRCICLIHIYKFPPMDKALEDAANRERNAQFLVFRNS